MATSRTKGHSRAKRRTEVPGQALGYSLQFTRLTHLLLQAPEGSLCSLELLEDVAQEDGAGGVILVQSKSALTANPVADRAKSLWKTLSNWIELAASPGFEVDKAIFELYVSLPVEVTCPSIRYNANLIMLDPDPDPEYDPAVIRNNRLQPGCIFWQPADFSANSDGVIQMVV